MSIKTAEDSLPSHGGSVSFVLYGDNGRSEEIKLLSENATGNLFEPGNIDKFEVSNLFFFFFSRVAVIGFVKCGCTCGLNQHFVSKCYLNI